MHEEVMEGVQSGVGMSDDKIKCVAKFVSGKNSGNSNVLCDIDVIAGGHRGHVSLFIYPQCK